MVRIFITTIRQPFTVGQVYRRYIAMAHGNGSVSASSDKKGEDGLPPLSLRDFTTYNRMAAQMDQFHNHFRLEWNDLQNTCAAGKRPGGAKTKGLILKGLDFCSQLDFHHSIEEEHVFPILARKMPEFRQKKTLLAQHKKIHRGLEKLEEYLEKCRTGDDDLELTEMKRLMDEFGDVLWTHLDEEVRTLGAENMRRYWSLEEMRTLPM